ncbi:MAG TPA: SDR family NAD(P)-dependent oxidoreductase [Pseudorhodoplanes sp.]|nr:SDR family NAD(P)-dependent oxidoreductase [Pseudorhodoplanes sp.]
MSKPLNGRIALVTGASRGIGFATAIALAQSGAHVVALARTVGGLEELDDEIKKAGSTATLVPLDLKDLDGIARLGAALNDRFGKLDVMVGNAGLLGPLSPLSHVEPKVWTELIAVNVTANWQLIRCMEPLLQKSDAGRAVLITSGASSKGEAYWGPYATSKAALDAMARAWAAENATKNLKVNLFSPGAVRTRMRATAFPGEDRDTLTPPEAVAAKIVELCLPAVTESGQLYSFQDGRFLQFNRPS